MGRSAKLHKRASHSTSNTSDTSSSNNTKMDTNKSTSSSSSSSSSSDSTLFSKQKINTHHSNAVPTASKAVKAKAKLLSVINKVSHAAGSNASGKSKGQLLKEAAAMSN